MNAKRRKLSLIHAGLALASLVTGSLAGALAPQGRLVFVLAGVAGYLLWGGKAMKLWPVRTRVADRKQSATSRQGPKHRIAATVAVLLLCAPVFGQQTIFNVPVGRRARSGQGLRRGRRALPADRSGVLFDHRPRRRRPFPRVEAGVNIGGLYAPGPSVPYATVAVKIQPVRAGDFTLTAGGYGLFYFDGDDGNPAGLGYGFASYRIPKLGTRIEFGGWYSSAGYARPTSTGGALATLEQPLPWIKGLTLAADWWSGENAIGYVSPGLIYTFGHWTAYAAYSIKNGDSRGNGGLIELGYAVLRRDHAGPDLSGGDDPAVLALGRLRAPLRPDLRGGRRWDGKTFWAWP